MSNPNGVPNVSNTVDFAARPRWTLTYKVAGQSFERHYDVLRRAEALSRLAAEVTGAYDIDASYSEVQL